MKNYFLGLLLVVCGSQLLGRAERPRHMVINNTPFNLRVAIDYSSNCWDNKKGQLNKRVRVFSESEAPNNRIMSGEHCPLTGMVAWIEEGPFAQSERVVGKDIRWNHAGFTGDVVWIINWNSGIRKLSLEVRLNTFDIDSKGRSIGSN